MSNLWIRAAAAQQRPQQLYHGTDAVFAPGHHVLPGVSVNRSNHLDDSDPQYAYASTSKDIAGYFASLTRDPGSAKSVYEVHPLSTVERDPYDDNGTSFRSPHGFRVIRRVPDEHWSYAAGRRAMGQGDPPPWLDESSGRLKEEFFR